jgi:2'-5' RNA ligase|tara:strand:- start:9304 stop:9885 length:582 start_codon:yes stop_codon:yes gene_type:complete
LTSSRTHLRTFVALKPEAKIITQLAACIDGLQGCGWSDQVRWTADSNIHMTLRFLGNTDATVIPELLQGISDGWHLPQITYEIDRIVIFPTAARPRVIAAMVVENERLNALAEAVEKLVQSHGFAVADKSFRGHFTLGRCRRGFPKRASVDYPVDPMRSEASEIVLYQSVTKPSGAVYTSLGTIDQPPFKSQS